MFKTHVIKSIPVNVTRILLILLSLLTTFAICAASGYAQDEVAYLHAERVSQAPLLDGKLDDPCWNMSGPVTEFVQQQPVLGGEPGFSSSVSCVYDSQALYFAFEIHSVDPSGLVSNVLYRDGNIFKSDDCFVLSLDTFHDHRDFYYFIVNPQGIQLDGRFTDEGVHDDPYWDRTWQAKTSLIEDGWAGEIAIPIRNVRFSREGDGVWGLGLMIHNVASSEYTMWPTAQKLFAKTSSFGHLTGLNDLEPSESLVFQPSAIQGAKFGRHERINDDPSGWKSVKNVWEKDLGLDIRYSPSSNIVTGLALNPDFATIESDHFLFNLTVDDSIIRRKGPSF